MSPRRKNLSLVLLICGIWILVFPQLRILYNEFRIEWQIQNYDQNMTDIPPDDAAALLDELGRDRSGEGSLADAEGSAHPESDLDISDPFYYDVAPDSLPLEVFGDEAFFGYIQIPKIGETLPLYIGATDHNLSRGAAQVTGSSLPVGGAGTHSVISAHRGYAGANFFRFIDRLVPGDRFTIHVLNQVLTYEVTGYAVIQPHDTSSLYTVPGEDLVTLLSCHPYRVNNQRILVYARRVQEEREGQASILRRFSSLYANAGIGSLESETAPAAVQSVGRGGRSAWQILTKFLDPSLEPSVRREVFFNRLIILTGILATFYCLLLIQRNNRNTTQQRKHSS